MKKVFIAGIGQFVGFALCNHLLEEGVQVAGYMKKQEDKQKQNIAEEKMMLIGRNALFERLESLKENNAYDAVFYCMTDPADRVNENNSYFLKQCTNLSIQQNIPFILVSSTEVFGDKQTVIEKETVPVPTTENGKSHFRQEAEVQTLFGETKLYRIVRIPGLYGPWQPVNMYVHQCIMSSLTGVKSNEIKSEETRDLIFIDDAVSSLLDIVKLNLYGGTVIHLSSMKNQWNQVAELFSEKLPGDSVFSLSKDIIHVVKNSVSLKEGIQMQKEWIKQNLYIYQ
ncbi:NAD(P)-dependent oxidoreductase [Bacillus sp. PAMC26568]|nr:NAD(P)-dependent oxidoreductase [Bacillus sp. PAMC26568]